MPFRCGSHSWISWHWREPSPSDPSGIVILSLANSRSLSGAASSQFKPLICLAGAAASVPAVHALLQFDASGMTLLREGADTDNLAVDGWVRKGALDGVVPQVVGRRSGLPSLARLSGDVSCCPSCALVQR